MARSEGWGNRLGRVLLHYRFHRPTREAVVAGAGGSEDLAGERAGAGVLAEGGIEGTEEFHPAHAGEDIADPAEGGRVVGTRGESQPLHQDLVVAPGRE